MVIVFRLFPDVEFAYLLSSFSHWLTEPEVQLLEQGQQENVFDGTKSGGLLLNANVASVYLVAVVALYGWQFWRKRNNLLFAVGLLAAVAVPFTGSKTPVFLTLVLVAAIGTIYLAAARRWRLLVGGLVLAASAFIAVLLLRPQRFAAAVSSLDDRFRLWGLAADELRSTPWLGLGGGGWSSMIDQRFTEIFGESRPKQLLPPHNFVLQAWSDAGIVAALLVFILALIPAAAAARTLFKACREGEPIVGASLVFVGLTWVPIHALTDTTAFFGENHVLPLYASLVAIQLTRGQGAKTSSIEARR